MKNERGRMKEFYFKEKNGETYFFFRDKKKSKLSYEEWKEKCDGTEIENNETMEKLMKFLKLDDNSRMEVRVENLNITIWKNREYRFTRLIMESEEKPQIKDRIIYDLRKEAKKQGEGRK